MPQVSVKINGYSYTVGCEEGQEQHLAAMGREVENRIDSIKALGGQSGEARLLVLAALLMGLRAPLPGVLLGFGFVALLTVSLASLSYAIAMKVATPQEFGPLINMVSMPSMLLSGLMLPMTLAPGWLDVLSHFVPFRYLVDAVRDAYVGDYTGAHMLYGALVAVGFAALSVTVGTRVFRTAGA